MPPNDTFIETFCLEGLPSKVLEAPFSNKHKNNPRWTTTLHFRDLFLLLLYRKKKKIIIINLFQFGLINSTKQKSIMINEPFKRQHHKKVKHTQIIPRKQLTNCLSVFDHFVGLALKELTPRKKLKIYK